MTARSVRCVVFAMLLAPGCSQPEGIRVRDESTKRTPIKELPAEQKKFRTLAALIPGDSLGEGPTWWVFKLSGPADVVAKREAEFNAFIDSVRVSSDRDQPIDWTLPSGWTKGDERQMRFATLVSPEPDKSEIAVSRAGGTVFQNVQRWYIQLCGKENENDVNAANLYDHARKRVVNDRLVIQVNFAGPKDPNAGTPMMGMPNPHGGPKP